MSKTEMELILREDKEMLAIPDEQLHFMFPLHSIASCVITSLTRRVKYEQLL